jgi:tRNA threonylcarbamoyladenosine biosynthesis protein TsaB
VKVIAIDTAGPVIGVSLAVDGVVTERTERVRRGAEGRLLPWVLDLLNAQGLRVSDLSGIAVAKGPGAFTGLRVGLACGAGLAYGRGIPLWTENSLRSRALRLGGPVLAALDARKGRVYAALYSDTGALLKGPSDVPPEDAASWAGSGMLVTGEGALAYRQVFEAAGCIVDPDAADPSVGMLASLAVDAFERGEGGDPVKVEPLYVREPDAKPPKTGV